MVQKNNPQPVDYQGLQAELDQILLELQREDIDVDVALRHYENGLKIVKQLEAYLTRAENKIIELQAQFGA